jgi:hypothetical protein
VEHFARRFDADPSLIAPEGRRVFQAGGGEFKGYRLPLRVRAVDRIAWFCVGRGDRNANGRNGGGAKEIRRLLREVHAVGKKTGIGYGRVREWAVEPVGEDWSWFAPSDAGPVLMRPMPACAALPDGLQGFRRWFGAPVPPYWWRPNYCETVVPC